MSDPLDLTAAAVWLLFYQQPSDRALAGWAPVNGPGGLSFLWEEDDGEAGFVEWVAEELLGD